MSKDYTGTGQWSKPPILPPPMAPPTQPPAKQSELAEAITEIRRLQSIVKDLQRQVSDKCDECAGFAHVIIESGFTPGVDSSCRCVECKAVCKGMAEAGYMARVKDWWWDDENE